VYPTYHAAKVLAEEPAVDFIIRGEGEATAAALVESLAAAKRDSAPNGPHSHQAADFWNVLGIAYRVDGEIVLTPERPPIRDLDADRVGWELIANWDDYRCFGLGRAAIIQFSRGCPHQCTYCGQHGFWVKWRHRDPVRLADEIEWLHRTHHVSFLTLADENPTTLRDLWRRFLEELAARRLPVSLFATIRATDIVRDADLLPLYRKAGVLYVLLGIESTSDAVLRQIKKGSTTRHDYQACRLLKRHGIYSIIGHIVGFEDERWRSFRTALRQLRLYDGDYLNAMYVTPHSWTAYGQEVQGRDLVQRDQCKWDYRHQVLAQKHLKPWQLFAGVKWLELCFHLRPARLWTLFRERDPFRRRQAFWVFSHIAAVWLAEVIEFLLAPLLPRQASKPAEWEGQPGTDVGAVGEVPCVHQAARRAGVVVGRSTASR
jgi:anaerobic magnesium-protoporphyrin IX monomethyl ester cyclase